MQQINVKHFMAALQRVAPAVPNNSILPITECIYINNGIMTATNTNLSIQTKVDFTGTTVLPHKLLFNLLGTVTTELASIYEEDKKMYIQTQDFKKYNLGQPQDASYFPVPVIPTDTTKFEAGESFFKTISNAVKCQSEDETYKTHGVNISNYITGTNNTVIYTAKTSYDFNLHVSPLFVKACGSMAGGTVQFNNNFISADDGNIKVICKLIDQPYVDITPVMNAGNQAVFNLKINKDALLHDLETIEVYGHPIRVCSFIISPNKLHVHYYNADFDQGSDSDLQCETSIAAMEVNVNVPEMIRILQVQPDGFINMCFRGNNAIIIQPENNKNILSFILPCL